MRKNLLSMKTLFTIAFALICLQKGFAQFIWAEIGVDGLTCSQCSRSVEMSLLKLDFVHEVQMNLEHTTGKITFKKGIEVNLKKIAKAITDGGFSVRYLKVSYPFSNFNITHKVSLSDATGQFCFVNTEAKKLNGDILLTIISKEFMPRPDYIKWKEAIEKCCGKITKEIYYVTVPKITND